MRDRLHLGPKDSTLGLMFLLVVLLVFILGQKFMDFGLPWLDGEIAFELSLPGDDVGAEGLFIGQALNINKATQKDLETLPGIGKGMARRIIKDREKNGPFHEVSQLKRVKGIGPKKFREIHAFIRI